MDPSANYSASAPPAMRSLFLLTTLVLGSHEHEVRFPPKFILYQTKFILHQAVAIIATRAIPFVTTSPLATTVVAGGGGVVVSSAS